MFWFATSADRSALTFDDLLAAASMRAAGLEVAPLVWGEFPPGLRAGDVVVVRSCWDYHLAPVRFLAWLRALESGGARVANGVDAIEWNLHKQYLLELQREHGIPIPPTVLVRKGEKQALGTLMAQLGTGQVVVKPAISLSAYDTQRFHDTSPQSQRAFKAQCARHDVLVQAFVPQIRDGEYSLVFFDNQFSHAVLKVPGAQDFRVQQDFGGVHRLVKPPASVVDQASDILAATGDLFPYARVDGVLVDGRLLLMELELIDPVLFFGLGGKVAHARFTDVMRAFAGEVACAVD